MMLILMAGFVAPGEASFGFDSQDQIVQEAIKRLRSSSEAEREDAKRTLVQGGSNAVGPLLTTLAETIYPTFAILSGERESARPRIDLDDSHWQVVVDHFENSNDKELDASDLLKAADTQASLSDCVQELRQMKARMRDDIIVILRRLGAEEGAVPLLVENLYSPIWLLDLEGCETPNVTIIALISIGPKAAPAVLELFDMAERIAASTISPYPRPTVRGFDGAGSPAVLEQFDMAEGIATSTTSPDLKVTNKREEILVRQREQIILMRTARVLGEIAGKEALLSLEQSLKRLAEQGRLELRMERDIEEAIVKIGSRITHHESLSRITNHSDASRITNHILARWSRATWV
jgi:hypothetical protein